ncbi:MAG: hypothetical protein ABSG79_23340 [Bryobacteraceae bacterium]|jgi:hypothetical protein
MSESVKDLASYRRCTERIHENWPRFLDQRKERLVQQERFGTAAEKVAENILEDLFTIALDWTLSDLNNQVEYADLLLTHVQQLPQLVHSRKAPKPRQAQLLLPGGLKRAAWRDSQRARRGRRIVNGEE